jgi:hypothetical protein
LKQLIKTTMQWWRPWIILMQHILILKIGET